MNVKNTDSSLHTSEEKHDEHAVPQINNEPQELALTKNAELEPPLKPDLDVDIESIFRELAQLPEFDYYRSKGEKAKQLGITGSELDKLVKPYKSTAEPNSHSNTVMFPQIEQWHEPVDGALLLYAIVAVIERHIACERHVAQTAALWIMFSWCIKVMKIAPIACITAPEKRCGKTQLLTLMNRLCLKSLSTSNITAPALFRSIEKWKPTLFIDEADAFLKQNEEMRGVLNAGFEVDGCVIRTVGEDFTPTPFNVFCAKAISGIGHLPDTLKDRSILLELRRKRKDEKRERLRHADAMEFDEIKRKLARWADDNMEALRIARPTLPDALNDRAQDCWEPLLAIADQVGGEWPQIARNAAMAISDVDDQAPSINEELLSDIKDVFESLKVVSISSTHLLEKLCSDEEAAWCTWNKGKEMTPRQLSKRLSEFGITPKQIRFSPTKGLKGYELSAFSDVFNRYLIGSTSDSSETTKQVNDSNDLY